MRETGSVKTRTSQRGRKHALTPEDLQNIDRVVQQEPDITIDEIIDKLGLHVCNETVRKAVIIAIPENNAKNSALQNVNYCVTDFRRTPVRLQICSLQFALCSTAFFALFSGLAIEKTMRNTLREFLKLSRQSPRSRASTDFGSLLA